jgi:hypothetical protein
MKLKSIKIIGISLLALGLSSSVFATEFSRTGTVKRILIDSKIYGGCMIQISANIGNGCPTGGWVSLDCTQQYYTSATDSKNKYALALTAFSLDKKLTVVVDNTKKHNGFCVARRVDMK